MKKIIALTLIILLFLPFPKISAKAESGEFARITTSGVYLYSSPDENDGLFTLPQSYFVKITGETDDYYYVSYLADEAPYIKISGYCKKSEITRVSFIPDTPYLKYQIEITYTLSNELPENPLSTYKTFAVYYGEFNFGTSVFYYVNLNGQFGYIPSSNCSKLDYPVNTEHTFSENETPQQSEFSSKQNNAIRIVLICVLSVFAIGAIYFLFKPQKTKNAPKTFYDENEDY